MKALTGCPGFSLFIQFVQRPSCSFSFPATDKVCAKTEPATCYFRTPFQSSLQITYTRSFIVIITVLTVLFYCFWLQVHCTYLSHQKKYALYISHNCISSLLQIRYNRIPLSLNYRVKIRWKKVKFLSIKHLINF